MVVFHVSTFILQLHPVINGTGFLFESVLITFVGLVVHEKTVILKITNFGGFHL